MPQADPPVQKQIGRYRVLERLGSGGSGSVWKALDTATNRLVALKILPEWFAPSAAARKRFLEEVRITSDLDHPGIVPVFDAGESDGYLYIASAFITGESVTERLKRGPLTVNHAVEFARQLAESLAHAHERGIVHRDVSASNVMLTADARAVLLDFGLAFKAEVSRTTRSGDVLVGTIPYLAPEVLTNR